MRSIIDYIAELFGFGGETDVEKIVRPITRITDKLEVAREKEIRLSERDACEAERLKRVAESRQKTAENASRLSSNLKNLVSG